MEDKWDSVEKLRNGLVRVGKDGKYAILNDDGRARKKILGELSELKWDEITDSSNGIICKIGGKYAFFGHRGNSLGEVSEIKWDLIEDRFVYRHKIPWLIICHIGENCAAFDMYGKPFGELSECKWRSIASYDKNSIRAYDHDGNEFLYTIEKR